MYSDINGLRMSHKKPGPIMRTSILLSSLIVLIAVSSISAPDIFDAVKANDLSKVERLISQDADVVGRTDHQDNTPLHFAAEGGQSHIAKILIGKGCDLNARNAEGNTPLNIAAISGHAGVAELLIKHGADVNAGNMQLFGPLHSAIVNKRDIVSELLIENGADVRARTVLGQTPLHLAVDNDREAIAELLIKRNAEIDSRDNYGRTPFAIVARQTGNVEIAKLLIRSGADINAKDSNGQLPLDLAAWKGYTGLIDLLLDEGGDITITGRFGMMNLRFAADCGSMRLFQEILQRTGDQLFASESENTATMRRAIGGGSTRIVNALLAKKIPIPNDAGVYGWTPLHHAARNGHSTMVELLVENGAYIDAKTLSGMTAFNLAEKAGKTEVLSTITLLGGNSEPQQFPKIEGPYLGQEPPDRRPRLFAPDVVSYREEDGNHSSLTISSGGEEIYWGGRCYSLDSEGQPKYGIWTTRLENGSWTKPRLLFGDETHDDVPFISPDNKKMFFTSVRPLETTSSKKENIWYAVRTATGWSKPKPVSSAVNAMKLHWQVSVSNSGTLYFGGTGQDTHGSSDIYYSRYENGEYKKPVNLGSVINSEGSECCPFIAPDESFIIYSRFGDGEFGFRVSFKDEEGQWQSPKRLPEYLGPICPVISPDGKYMFYCGEMYGNEGIYWLDASFIEELRAQG
jgi:ankyrin repeat protein